MPKCAPLGSGWSWPEFDRQPAIGVGPGPVTHPHLRLPLAYVILKTHPRACHALGGSSEGIRKGPRVFDFLSFTLYSNPQLLNPPYFP